MNFEASMQELEKIVKSLESGDLSLEESISEFEKGIALVKNCKSLLDKAQGKVTTLLEGIQNEKEKD